MSGKIGKFRDGLLHISGMGSVDGLHVDGCGAAGRYARS